MLGEQLYIVFSINYPCILFSDATHTATDQSPCRPPQICELVRQRLAPAGYAVGLWAIGRRWYQVVDSIAHQPAAMPATATRTIPTLIVRSTHASQPNRQLVLPPPQWRVIFPFVNQMQRNRTRNSTRARRQRQRRPLPHRLHS